MIPRLEIDQEGSLVVFLLLGRDWCVSNHQRNVVVDLKGLNGHGELEAILGRVIVGLLARRRFPNHERT